MKTFIVFYRAERGLIEQRAGTFRASGEVQAMSQAARTLSRNGYAAIEMRAVLQGGV